MNFSGNPYIYYFTCFFSFYILLYTINSFYTLLVRLCATFDKVVFVLKKKFHENTPFYVISSHFPSITCEQNCVESWQTGEFCFSFFILWHINLCGLLKAKAIFVERQYSYYFRENKRVHAFPKYISLKVNLIAQLEFELAYYDVVVPHINPYTMGDSLIYWTNMYLFSFIPFLSHVTIYC